MGSSADYGYNDKVADVIRPLGQGKVSKTEYGFRKVDKLHWVAIFGIAYIGAYILNFTVVGVEPSVKNLVVEVLPVIAMFATHLAYRCNAPKTLRYICLISSVSWLIFNIVNFAIGAILCETFSLASIAIATFREKKKE